MALKDIRHIPRLFFLMACAAFIAGHPARAKNMIFSTVPWGNEAEMKAIYEPLMEYIDENTGARFDIVMFPTYDDLVKEVSSGMVHFACLNPVTYLKAKQQNSSIRYLATSIRDYGGLESDHYLGYIITKKSSNINVFTDLKGKIFGFVEETSSSGYKMPMAYMREQGLNPKTFFKKYFFLGNHDEVAKAVKNGTVDAGATWQSSYIINVKRFGDIYKIIYTTPPIPNDAWVTSPRMPKKQSDMIKQLLLGTDRATRTAHGKIVLDPKTTGNPDIGFAERDPEFYDRAAPMLLYKE